MRPLSTMKEILRRANTALGSPVCSAEERAERNAARARLAELRKQREEGRAVSREKARVQAPVTIYFEKDRNARELERIVELLASKGIESKRLDVTDDENTLDFVMRKANVEQNELPVVFVADKAIGRYQALVDANVSGALDRELYVS